jgi:protein phosphatase 1 regulatory subunit 37
MGGVALALMIRDYPDSSMSMSSLSSAPTTNPNLNSPGLSQLSDHSTPSYTPRTRRQPIPDPNADDPSLPPIPKVTSSGGITSRTIPEGYLPRSGSVLSLEGGVNLTPVEGKMVGSGSASMALQRSVRALDGVERIGRLLTLDLKGNEIKVSEVLYHLNKG